LQFCANFANFYFGGSEKSLVGWLLTACDCYSLGFVLTRFCYIMYGTWSREEEQPLKLSCLIVIYYHDGFKEEAFPQTFARFKPTQTNVRRRRRQ